MHLPQFFQSVMQPRFHGPQRAVKGGRNLAQRRPRKESQLDDQAMLFRQARHRTVDSLGIFGRLRGTIRQVISVRRLVKAFRRSKLGGPMIPPLQEPVSKNAVQPGRELATTVETRQGPPCLYQGLLDKVFGQVAIPAKDHRASP